MIDPKKKKGFSASQYDKQSRKAGKKYQRQTKPVKEAGIATPDQRSSMSFSTRRVPKKAPKPMNMTYGSSTKSGKGTTKYKRGK